MVSITLYLDTRKLNAQGQGYLRFRLSHHGKKTLIPTAYAITPEQWDGHQVVGHPQARTINRMLLSLANAYTEAAYAIRDQQNLDVTEIKRRILATVSDEPTTEERLPTLLEVVEEHASRFTKKNTISIWTSTRNHIEKFGDIALDKIKLDWLIAFDNYLATYCPKKNTRNIHLRNIRAAVNYAIDMEYTTNYPFRRFKITPEQTPHRTLTRDQLHEIATKDYQDEIINYHRDMFMLSFYLIGINYEDMSHLTDIVRGRINYHRSKTNKLYSIKVEPEAMEIIKRHPGEQYLVNILGRYASPHTLIEKSCFNLKKIFPGLTTYYARHTWATLAAELDIPKETISAALGHSIGSAVTSIYINFDQKKIDEANRKVIDYVLSE